jgi:hypothetical protein
MELGKDVEALLHMRKLRGGSQPILVRANDGFFYVVKFLNNLQGPNVLFNEAVGTALFTLAGLPTPEWRPVYVTEEFIERNPSCWMETEDGRLKPQAGWCFGSRFLCTRNSGLFELLPQRSFIRISNRRDFWTVWVIDALCGHTDNRQTLFLQRKSMRLGAYFIDHGHLFGGAHGVDCPSFLASRYLDPRIYALASARDADDIVNRIQSLDLAQLAKIVGGLPEEWVTEAGRLSFESFTSRISDPILLRSAVNFILHIDLGAEGSHDRHLARGNLRFERAALHSQISAPGGDDRFDGGSRHPARAQGRRGPQAVRPLCSQAANF